MKRLLAARLLPIIVCAIFLVLLGLSHFGVMGAYLETVLIYIGINIILAVSLNLVNGYMGEFSVGHAGFMAIGAYTAAVLTVRVIPYHLGPLLFPVALLGGAITAGLAGLVIAFPSFRTRGDYLAIVTLAFLMIVKSGLENIDALGGARGFMGIERLTSVAWTFVWVVITLWLSRNFIHSRFGRGVLSIREDETAAELVGVNTRQVKVFTFVFSAMLAGIAGGLFAHTLLFINPRSFSIVKSTDMLVMIYLGGASSLGGSILGASLFTMLQEGLRQLFSSLAAWNVVNISQEWIQVVTPLLLVLLMIFRPRGIMGGREFRFLRPREQKSSGPEDARSPFPAGGDPVSPGALSVRDLSHNFAGLRAVSDFSLDLDPGDLVALIGPNGAGKTTVFNLLTGIYRPASGRMIFNGMDLVGLSSSQIVGRGIARTFQNIRLFKQVSVLDNLRIAQYAHTRYSLFEGLFRLPRFVKEERRIRSRSLELLKMFGLEDMAEKTAGSLPYGQQRRLEIARALATGPQLLLLDEPAAGMNPAEAEELMHLILQIHRDFRLTILLIEHQMAVVMGAAQRVIVLDFGRTICSGTPEEVRSDPRVIETYLGEDGVI